MEKSRFIVRWIPSMHHNVVLNDTSVLRREQMILGIGTLRYCVSSLLWTYLWMLQTIPLQIHQAHSMTSLWTRPQQLTPQLTWRNTFTIKGKCIYKSCQVHSLICHIYLFFGQVLFLFIKNVHNYKWIV